MLPIISFVMPVYNNQKYVRNAVDSILSQSNEKIELILVDDGSTDGTPQILDGIKEQNNNVEVIHQSNQWIYASFNNGVKRAKGEYIYIVNSDDKLAVGMIDLLIKKILQYNYPDIVWTNVVICKCDEAQHIIASNHDKVRKKVPEERYFSCTNEVRNAWPYFVSSGLAVNQANLYKRELVINHPFRNDVYGADYLFNMNIADDVTTAVVLPELVYQFYDYNSSTMNTSIGKYYGYEHEMFDEIFYGYLSLFEKWRLSSESYINFLFRERKRYISHEIKILSYSNCKMNTDEKLKHIFQVISDEKLIKVLGEENREEFESRILSGTKDLLLKEQVLATDEMYFVYEMLESLLRYEKDALDYRRIERGVFHDLNPNHIGKCFYDKLMKQSCSEQ